ncbi:F-box/WD repeat-containing protein 1A like [Verticillium longisporum]|uniref:F-box/WD repeat-containing protein 1A like n=1 Tax=Verticillium longisporum TaxID=100787 RepID=A0A8I3AKF4_VERLO|nr:F-box/WD repeat-containing protein 1A like [Verticillium longisporum]
MQFPSQPDEGYSEDPLNPTSTGSSATSTRPDLTHASRPGNDLVVPSDLPAWLERNLPYLPVSAKTQLAMALLDHLPTSVVAQIAERLHPRLYINFIQYLPPEVCLKILGYLDPVSLLGVAQSCREWYSLALDRKLWEKLYHMEGWQALYPEIRAWEDRMNESANSMSSSVSSHHHVVVSEDGHTCKKRGISEDDDQEMVDADRLPRPEGAFAGAGGSIFGTPGLVPTLPSSSRGDMDVDASRSSSKSGGVDHSPARDVKGKGKAVDSADDLSRDTTPTPPSFLSKPSLWSWDPSQSRYKLNWKHVYTLRRKLEANWEQGKFTNFQLPRPDHPEEGHQECIYTLQFDAHYLSVLNVKFDKRILVTCSKDKSIKIFNRRPLKYGDLGYPNGVNPVPIRIRDNRYGNPTDDLPIIAPYTMIGRLDGHGAAVNAVQIHGNEVVSASGDRNIKVWDWAKQVCTRTVVGHTKGIACVQYDGRRIVSGSSDNEVKVFDCLTGLEVASLRAHSHLVRTVQAGFGDLPYSEIEDKAEAKKIDEQYFKALESGAIEAPVGPGSHRTRPRNAGSSRPEDITAYGATLPPGGGGGKYARIVSGSYDQKIIIWRRLKEGEWVVLHGLRQEEAAEAAQSWAATSGSIPVPAPASTVPVPAAAHPPAPILASFSSHQPFPPRASTPGSAAPPQAGTPQSQNTPSRTTVETPIIATVTPESTHIFVYIGPGSSWLFDCEYFNRSAKS